MSLREGLRWDEQDGNHRSPRGYNPLMDYADLSDFVRRRRRMSHVYQPAMLRAPLGRGGECPVEEIARAILSHDRSQVEYYEALTNNMVGRVPRSHGIVERDGRSCRVLGTGAYCRVSFDE